MSQNSAIPACITTTKLRIAAIAIPAMIPITIDRTLCDKYPIATPATNPFNIEKVITLPIIGPSEGSKNPLKPSIKPNVPPTIKPSTGLVTIFSSRLPFCGAF